MTGSGRGDRETAAVEAAVTAAFPTVPRGGSAARINADARIRAALAAARPHLRAEVAAEIVEALRRAWPEPDEIDRAGLRAAAKFIEERFVSVRPDNEEAK